MKREYYYLISSLPWLCLGEKPKCNSVAFLALCQEHLTPVRLEQLEAVTLYPNKKSCCSVERSRQVWETCLRNGLTRLRAAALEVESAPWLQEEADVFPNDARRIEEICADANPARRERGLDELRWQHLDSLAVGHEFDFDALVIYRLHLLLAEKWADLSAEQGQNNMRSLAEAGIQQAENKRSTIES